MADNDVNEPEATEPDQASPEPEDTPKPPKKSKDKSKDKTAGKDKSKDKKDKKDKKGKDKSGAEATLGSSVATHPRARSSVRRVKGWAGIAGFGIAAVLSLQASVPVLQAGERALAAGVVGYLLAWWFSVMIWRQLIIAEQRAAIEAIARRRAESDPKQAEAQATRV